MAIRSPVFYELDRHKWPVEDVLPGDAVSSPGVLAWKLIEKNNSQVVQYRLSHAPFMIIGVEVSEASRGKLYTYYVLTRHGVLVILKIDPDKD